MHNSFLPRRTHPATPTPRRGTAMPPLRRSIATLPGPPTPPHHRRPPQRRPGPQRSPQASTARAGTTAATKVSVATPGRGAAAPPRRGPPLLRPAACCRDAAPPLHPAAGRRSAPPLRPTVRSCCCPAATPPCSAAAAPSGPTASSWEREGSGRGRGVTEERSEGSAGMYHPLEHDVFVEMPHIHLYFFCSPFGLEFCHQLLWS